MHATGICKRLSTSNSIVIYCTRSCNIIALNDYTVHSANTLAIGIYGQGITSGFSHYIHNFTWLFPIPTM